MGWKNIRDHYRIGHIVKIVAGDVHVGSAYIGDLLIIRSDGSLSKRDEHWSRGDLARYQEEIDADPDLFAKLLAQPDAFGALTAVYTWEDGAVIERACEETGWPNVTTDGHLMHDNRYTTDPREALERGRRDAAAAVETYARIVAEAEAELDSRRGMLSQGIAIADRIGADVAASSRMAATHGSTATAGAATPQCVAKAVSTPETLS